jgi:hypothetical protein
MRDIQEIEIAILNLQEAIAPADDTDRGGLRRLPSLSTLVIVRHSFFPIFITLIDQYIQNLAVSQIQPCNRNGSGSVK